MATDLDSLAPASYQMRFPRRVNDTYAVDDPYVVDILLADLALPEYGTCTGAAGVVRVEYSSVWASTPAAGTLTAMPPITFDGVTTENEAELQALALQAATDYYLWLLSPAMASYAGAAAWVMEGHTDLVEFCHGEDLATVASWGAGTAPDPGLVLPQSSPTQGSDDSGGCCTEFNGVIVTVNGSVVNSTSSFWNWFSSVLTFVSSTLNFGAVIWNWTQNVTQRISSSKRLTITGGKVIIQSPMEICGWLYLCAAEDTLDSTENDYQYPVAEVDGEEDGYSVLNLTANIGDTRLTGIVADFVEDDGLTFWLCNVGPAGDIVIPNEDFGSTAAYRFVTPGAKDLYIVPGGAAQIRYDTLTHPDEPRWRFLSPEAGGETGTHSYVSSVTCVDGTLTVVTKSAATVNGRILDSDV